MVSSGGGGSHKVTIGEDGEFRVEPSHKVTIGEDGEFRGGAATRSP